MKNGWKLLGKLAMFSFACVCVIFPASTVFASQNNTKTLATGYNELETRVPGRVYGTGEIDCYTSGVSSSYYKTANLPAIRNQGIYGTCWAHSTLACAEINLMKKGYTDIDLSEMHLAYFAYNSVNDPLRGLTGDTNAYLGEALLDEGGNYNFAATALADWLGAANETLAPFTSTTANTIHSTGLADSLAYEDIAHLENFYYISNNQTDIKNAVVKYGAVGINYHAVGSYASNSYYNSNTAGYYCYDELNTNHAVTIVGWDDNYSASNFPTTPEGNGAWIVRNSWGSNYGKDGYFYLSYYDKSMGDQFFAVDFAIADNYDNNYQYDGTMWYDYITLGTETKVANVFTAKANGKGAEEIAAVSFETGTVNVNYTVEVFTNLTDVSNPESGTLSATATGTTTYEGQYTVKLSKPAIINSGEMYAIVVTLKGHSNNYVYVAVDCSYYVSDWFQTVSSAGAGQSFYCYGDSWYDYGAEYNENIRIKAYTNNVTLTGLAQASDGNWYYYKNGVIDTSYTGLVQNTAGWWYVKNGKLDFSYNGLVENTAGLWYVKTGKIDFSYTGIVQSASGWWYVKAGKVDTTYTGVATNSAGIWYIKNGKIDWSQSGLKMISATEGYYFKAGKVDTSYTNIVQSESGWWYVQKGKVDTTYIGVATNSAGIWYIKNGKIDWSQSGLKMLSATEGYYFKTGKVDTSYTNIVQSESGWWYVQKGKVDTTYNGVATNSAGTWSIKNGKIDWSQNGLKIISSKEGYYFKNGKVDTTYTNIVQSESGWWYVQNGKIDFSYIGLAQNSAGLWYIKNGKIDWMYNGTVVHNGVTYTVVNGKVVS